MTRMREPKRSTSSSTWLETITVRALLPQTAEQLDRSKPLAGIEPFERLVEDEEIRVVDDRLGQLDPLAHPLRVGDEGAAVAGIQLDGLDGPEGRLARVGEAVQGGGQADELDDRLAFEEPLLLGGDADAAGQRRVGSAGPLRKCGPYPATGWPVRTGCERGSTCPPRSARAGRSRPGPTSKLRSDRATTDPNHLATWRTSMRAPRPSFTSSPRWRRRATRSRRRPPRVTTTLAATTTPVDSGALAGPNGPLGPVGNPGNVKMRKRQLEWQPAERQGQQVLGTVQPEDNHAGDGRRAQDEQQRSRRRKRPPVGQARDGERHGSEHQRE